MVRISGDGGETFGQRGEDEIFGRGEARVVRRTAVPAMGSKRKQAVLKTPLVLSITINITENYK